VQRVKIASFGLYDPTLINSGSDSYTDYILPLLLREYEDIHYFTSQKKDDIGFTPEKIEYGFIEKNGDL
jgi:hypothetical protein